MRASNYSSLASTGPGCPALVFCRGCGVALHNCCPNCATWSRRSWLRRLFASRFHKNCARKLLSGAPREHLFQGQVVFALCSAYRHGATANARGVERRLPQPCNGFPAVFRAFSLRVAGVRPFGGAARFQHPFLSFVWPRFLGSVVKVVARKNNFRFTIFSP